MSDVVTLGEVLASFVALDRGAMAEAASFARTVAGAEANVAVGLARLGVDVGFIGLVGDDGLGRAILRRLRGEGVNVDDARLERAAATGVMIRELRDLGPAEVVYWRRRSAGSLLARSDVSAATALFEGSRWLHVTGITPALSPGAADAVEAAVERAREAGATVSLDINMRRRLWSEGEARPLLAALAARCDVVLGSLDEVAFVAGSAATLDAGASADPVMAAEALLALGPHTTVVKLGADGALAHVRRDGGGPSPVRSVAFGPIHVVDPVGAGDAFTAGFIAASLDGATTEEALRVANVCGASAAATFGDLAGLPTSEELERLLTGAAARGPDTLR